MGVEGADIFDFRAAFLGKLVHGDHGRRVFGVVAIAVRHHTHPTFAHRAHGFGGGFVHAPNGSHELGAGHASLAHLADELGNGRQHIPVKDHIVGTGAAQLGHFCRDIHTAGLGDNFRHHVEAHFFGPLFGGFNRVAAKFGVAVDQGHRGFGAAFGLAVDVFQQNGAHGRIGGAGHEVVRHLIGIGQIGGE